MTNADEREDRAAARRSAAAADTEWNFPDDESRPLPTMHQAALHGPLGRAACILAAYTQADVIALLYLLLAWFGNVLGFKPYTKVHNSSPHRANLGVVVVGRTGTGRKTTAWHAIRDFLVPLLEPLLAARDGWMAWTWADNVVSNVKSGEYLVHMVRDPIISAAGNMTDVGVPDKRKIVYEPEFSRLLKDAERPDNSLSEVHRQTHDENHLHTGAKTAEEKATHQHISWVMTSTQRDIDTYLSPEAMSNGFANRNLFCLSMRSAQTQTGDVVAALVPVANDLDAALASANPYDPHWDGHVPFTDAALALWDSIANGFEPVLVTDDLTGDMEVRFGFHVMKLALIYAQADGGRVIEPVHLGAALAVRHQGVGAIEFLFRQAVGANGRRVLDKMLEDQQRHITATGVRDLFHRHLSKQAAERLMRTLERQKLIRRVKVNVEVGRPPVTWELVTDDGVWSLPSLPSLLAQCRRAAQDVVLGPDRLTDEPLPDGFCDLASKATKATKANKPIRNES
jgi:hypothetical protein